MKFKIHLPLVDLALIIRTHASYTQWKERKNSYSKWELYLLNSSLKWELSPLEFLFQVGIIPFWIQIQSGNYPPLNSYSKWELYTPWIQIESGNYLPLNSNWKWELSPLEFKFKVGIIPPWILIQSGNYPPLNSKFKDGIIPLKFKFSCRPLVYWFFKCLYTVGPRKLWSKKTTFNSSDLVCF